MLNPQSQQFTGPPPLNAKLQIWKVERKNYFENNCELNMKLYIY